MITYKYILSAIILTILCMNATYAQVSHNEKIVKSFYCTDQHIVEINNRHGKIQIENSSTDSVKIVVSFSALSKTEEKLAKLVASVDFDFTSGGNYISASTKLGPTTGIHQDIENIRKAFSSASGNDITINYKVFLPRDTELKVSNKFGDVFINDRYNKTFIKVEHGNIRASSFFDDVEIENAYGQCNIKRAKEATLSLNHVDKCRIEQAKKLKIESKFSSIAIEEVNYLKINSKKDDIEIESINKLVGKCALPEIVIEKLNDELNINSKHVGTIEVEEIAHSFKSIKITSQFTDIELNIDNNSDHQFSLQHKDVDFEAPAVYSSLATKTLDDKKLLLTEGKIGPNPAGRIVEIDAQNCSLTLSRN